MKWTGEQDVQESLMQCAITILLCGFVFKCLILSTNFRTTEGRCRGSGVSVLRVSINGCTFLHSQYEVWTWKPHSSSSDGLSSAGYAWDIE